MSEKLSHCFTHDSIDKIIFRYTLPMFGAVLALLLYDVLESVLLAYSNKNTLAALGFTLPITTAMTALAIGLSIRTNNKIIKMSCSNKNNIASALTTLLIFSSLVIILLSILLLSSSEILLQLLGNNHWKETLSLTETTHLVDAQTTYLLVRSIGWIFLAFIWQVSGVFRAIGKVNIASSLMFSWLAFKSVLAVLILTPEGPFYHEGLLGLAMVHGLSDIIFAALSLLLIKLQFKLTMPTLKQLKQLFNQPKRDGFLVTSQQLITPISMAILTAIAANIDYSYVAAFALLFRLEAVFLLLPMVLTMSMPMIVGTNYWSGHVKRVKKAYISAFIIIIIAQLFIIVLLATQGDMLVALICPETSVQAHLENYLFWVPWGYLGAGCAIVYQSCLNAKGKTVQATLLGLTHRIFLIIPLAFFGGLINHELLPFDLSPDSGFYLGIMLGHLVAGFVVLYLYKHFSKKDVIHHTTEFQQEIAINS
jgi:Na+-driven multidrug efflux pump